MKQLRTLLSGLTVIAVIAALVLQVAPGAVALQLTPEPLAQIGSGEDLWQQVAGTPLPARPGAQPEIKALRFASYRLNRNGLAVLLTTAPQENSRQNSLVLSLPNPRGTFEKFAIRESPIMEPALAARHPDIKTYSGRGIDDPTATLRFDLTPLGFHASVRSAQGSWYIDPYYHLDDSLYVSYFGRDLIEDPHGGFDEREVEEAELSIDSPTPNPPTGDVLRIYRLALITDPGYAAYFGGSANVTPAKVTLINRVTQLYEEDLSIRLMLIANNDLLNLDTWAQAIGPNGPCGAAGCFTQSQVTGCSSTSRARHVIGQIIGASNYDIGHLALGQPGGGVANLGVVGRSNKAGGCTGIPTPVGDFYAVDYVAHEMGHQFSGNHTFNGNQLNCSGGNRSAANSVEPGSASSVMGYAGICLTDDLQAHSDPYFSQRSQQEISTYTSSNQAAINEVQTASLQHFGGGNEVQVVTFGPGYSRASTIQPLSLSINAAPTATSRGGAEENGTTVTIATGNAHTLQVGDVVTITGVAVAGYNGTFTVTAVPSTRSFQYTNPIPGLATSGGGTVTLAAPGATEVGDTVTIRTAAAHGRSVGDIVTISGVGVAAYNGTTITITAVPTTRTLQYTTAITGLANSGGGTVTYFSPFQVRISGNDSAMIGGSSTLTYTNANIQSAINGIVGFSGTVTVTNAAATGFTVSYGDSSAGLDVPNLEIINLNCGGCFASVEETNHGGANDSFRLNYDGNVSEPITNGVNYTAAGIQTALAAILPAGATATVAGFGGGSFNNTGFQVTFGGSLAATNVTVTLALQDFSTGASGFVGETDKGGAVDNKGGIITPSGNTIPVVTPPPTMTIPLRTPFVLTGSATDADDDLLLYSWEQNDRGGSAGTSLLNNTKTDGSLFAMFPKSGQITDTLVYTSPGENHLTTIPTRVLPDLQQILDNNTNAETGACSAGPIAPPVPQNSTECFAEFLPTSDYVGLAGVNASPLSLHFRFTARDGRGGVNSADTTLLLASGTGPFLVTSPNTAMTLAGSSTQTVTWNVANTDVAPVSTTDVKISLSIDGGHTYPYVLASSTPNDGSEPVMLPNISTTQARVKIEAVGNIFFDVSNADFTITPVSSDVAISQALTPGLVTPNS
ncbi:MAG TPA: M12 family metallo-peptidase, partial [Anaerolineae bacterium]|nr:M12 family metallo-peptidase [Anaerolineae bacterium]